jgi:hypothetical protein
MTNYVQCVGSLSLSRNRNRSQHRDLTLNM